MKECIHLHDEDYDYDDIIEGRKHTKLL